MMRNHKFVQLIKESGLVSAGILNSLIKAHGEGSLKMLEDLINLGILSKSKACELWSSSINIAYIDPAKTVVKKEIVRMIPEKFARQKKVIALYSFGPAVTVAMVDPKNLELVDELELIMKSKISPAFSLSQDIEAAISIHYQTKTAIEDYINEFYGSTVINHGELSQERIQDLSQSDQVVKIIDSVILFALKERASDIHIEPKEDLTLIRFRIDGLMRKVFEFPKLIHPALISRIKILAKMDIAEKRRPQDGRIGYVLAMNRIDLRVSIVPSILGEKGVLRILGLIQADAMVDLERMYISARILEPLKKIISNPNGAFFVTGPTGCGKTTTLYAVIKYINSPEKNIITIEDPVEYRIEGITQIQVDHKIGLDFNSVLRSVLRQDPDVILIGEIRDVETAKIASQAALTGHLVFSSLHTNTAVQAVTRLIDIGVEPFMVAPSIIGILSQRLVARICDNCKQAFKPDKEILKNYFHDEEDLIEVFFYRGEGCPECRGTGYSGRVAIHEFTIVSEEMRYLVAKNATIDKLLRAAKKSGYLPLRYDGLKKVLNGLTTIDEIERVTVAEW